MRFRRFQYVLCGVWLLAVACAGFALSSYENNPGTSGGNPVQWPADSSLNFVKGRPALVMFAHPHCPCTRSSIEELNRLLTHVSTNISVQVVFMQPSVMPKDWTQSALWKSASAIPGVTVLADADGAEAKRFGAESSGYVVLYNERGNLIFSGGITSARGHAGDNAGESAIIALLNNQNPNIKSTPVFGCGLLDPSKDSTN
jgi:hypothetical protein